jgi:protein SCO1/2
MRRPSGPRHRRMIRPAMAVALALAAALLAGCAATHSDATKAATTTAGTGTGDWSGAVPDKPAPKPDFTLTDQRGRRFALRQRTQGKITLLYFGYTHCPDVCPLTMSMLARAVHALSPQIARKVVVVFVTTDPTRDTPQRLAQWLADFDPTFVGLTGSRQAIAEAQRRAGAPPAVTESLGHGAGYGVDHGAFIYAYTPDNLTHLVYFQGVQPAALAADLRRLATRGWSDS